MARRDNDFLLADDSDEDRPKRHSKKNLPTVTEVKDLRALKKTVKKKKELQQAVEEEEEDSSDEDKSLKKVISVFGKSSQEIMDLLDANENDSAITLTKKHLLKTIISMLPEAEKVIRRTKTHRGIFGFVQLCNSARELMVEIQADKDHDFMAAQLTTQIVQPAMKNIANTIVTAHSQLKSQLADIVDPADKMKMNVMVNDTVKNIAAYMEVTYKDLGQKIEHYLE